MRRGWGSGLAILGWALTSLDPARKGRRRWAMRWKAPSNAFQIACEGRLTPATSHGTSTTMISR